MIEFSSFKIAESTEYDKKYSCLFLLKSSFDRKGKDYKVF